MVPARALILYRQTWRQVITIFIAMFMMTRGNAPAVLFVIMKAISAPVVLGLFATPPLAMAGFPAPTPTMLVLRLPALVLVLLPPLPPFPPLIMERSAKALRQLCLGTLLLLGEHVARGIIIGIVFILRPMILLLMFWWPPPPPLPILLPVFLLGLPIIGE